MRAPLVSNVNIISGYVVESLMARGYDEPFTLYGLVARTVETDEARSYVTFELDPAARFSDGKPVTPEDVIFSWQLLRDKGRPNHRFYYSKVAKAEVVGERAVRFDLTGSNDRELPLILGLMPVLAKHAVNARDVRGTDAARRRSAAAPTWSARSMPGKSVTLTRNPDYWGRDLPVNRGFWNFDEIRFDYYRDANSHHEAFKRGLFDLRTETDPGRWQTGYDFPAVRDGRVVKETFSTGLPKPSFYFVFNTRRPIFADIRVREAIALLFDFEWINHNLFFDLYRRSGKLLRRLRAVGARSAGRCARASTARAVSRRGARRRARRHLVAAGHRRLRPRSRTVRQRALELLSAAGYELRGTELVERAQRQAVHLRDHGRQPDRGRGRGAARARSSRATSSGPASTRSVRLVDAVQFETPAHRLRFRHDPESLGPVAVARQRAVVLLELGRRRRRTAAATTWACSSPAVDALIDAPGQGARRVPTSWRRCGRSTAS